MKRIAIYGLFYMLFTCNLQAQEEPDLREFGLAITRQSEKEAAFLANKNNTVMIRQIGSRNYSNVNVKALQSNIDVKQFGNSNYLDLYKNAREINQSVIQKGNNNTISDFSMSPYYNSNNQVIQYGNNLNYTSYGTNSISDDMKIIQKGNSGSVLIFNR